MTAAPEKDQKSLPVADRVLVQFVEALAEDEAVGDTAARLKTVLIGDKPVTEIALRQALFGESDT